MKCKRCNSWTPRDDTCALCGNALLYTVFGGSEEVGYTPTPRRIKEPSYTGNALLNEITAFCRKHSVSASRFGKDAICDSGLVQRLQNGANPRDVTASQVRAYIEKHS